MMSFCQNMKCHFDFKKLILLVWYLPVEMNNYIIFRTYKYTNMDEITGNGLKWIEQKKDFDKFR